MFAGAWVDAGRDPDQIQLMRTVELLPSAGLDNVDLHTAVITATFHPEILSLRSDLKFDIAVVFAATTGPNECGSVNRDSPSFMSGSASPLLPYIPDTRFSDSHYVMIISLQCYFFQPTTLAHEMMHLFGGTHAIRGLGDAPGVLDGEKANAYVTQSPLDLLNLGTLTANGMSGSLGDNADFFVYYYSRNGNWIFGDENHNNVSALQLTADSVALYRVDSSPEDPPPTPPPLPGTIILWVQFERCVNGYWAKWHVDWTETNADYYAVWQYPNYLLGFDLDPPGALYVNGRASIYVQGCNSNGCGPPSNIEDVDDRFCDVIVW